MKIRILLAALSIALVSCSKSDSTGTPPPASTVSTASAPVAISPQEAERLEEERVLKETVERLKISDAAEAASLKVAVADLVEAVDLLGVDPKLAIRGRIEACLSGDKRALAAFYIPFKENAFATNSVMLDYEFNKQCDWVGTDPHPDLDGLLAKVQIYARRSSDKDRVTGETIFDLCLSNTGPKHCADPAGSSWSQRVEVLGGRVLFLD